MQILDLDKKKLSQNCVGKNGNKDVLVQRVRSRPFILPYQLFYMFSIPEDRKQAAERAECI